MKLTGIIMMILFSTFSGIMITDYKKKQLSYINMLITIGELVQVLLRNTSPNTEEIMKRLKADSRLKEFDFSLKDENILLNNDCKDLVKGFFSSIGKYDAQTQIYLCNEFLNDVRSIKEEYQQNYNGHKKLYVAFGLLFGVFVSVLLI